MIPTRKKTPEELAALSEEFVIVNPNLNTLPLHRKPPDPSTLPPADSPHPSPPEPSPSTQPTPQLEYRPKKRRIHTLRKIELPLAPAAEIGRKTQLPTKKHASHDIAEIRRREALENIASGTQAPVAYLKQMTVHPALLIFTYLIAITAGFAAWQRVYFITPISLIFVSGLLTAYIFWKKKRSRHHAAILMIILVMTLVFGGIHYAPFFSSYAT